MAARKKTRSKNTVGPSSRPSGELRKAVPGGGRRLQENPAVTRVIDGLLLAVACLLVMGLHVILFQNSGAFWRDETSSIQLASVLPVHHDAAWLAKDSAPPLLHVLLRLWTALGYATGDAWIRFFGTVVSLGIMGSLIVSARLFSGRAPLLVMALVAFNPTVFYFGSSIRAYGLAMLFVVPCGGAFWRVVQRPTWRNVTASLGLALLSCHASYQNSYLLFAIGLAGMAVCGLCGLWRRCLLIMTLCGVTALSMLVYLPVIRAYADAAQITHFELTNKRILGGLTKAIANGDSSVLSLWLGLAALAVVFLIVRIVHSRGTLRSAPSLALYAFLVSLGATLSAYGFFRVNGMIPMPWHYAPLLALCGLLVEVAVGSRDERAWVWLLRTIAACALMLLSLPSLWAHAHMRRTNVDRLCAVLAAEAAADDFVLVSPFWLSPSFKYYYHGKAPWNTLPLTSSDLEVSLFPYPRFKQLMTQPDALDATLEQIDKTLAAGKKLWVVGAIQFPPRDKVPPTLPPAPQSKHGWNNNTYVQAWSKQVAHDLHTHALRSELVVPADAGQAVSRLENFSLSVFEGWH